MDAPIANAVGDVRRVTDGAIASGTNQLHSTAAAFTVGQAVEIVGAGAGGTSYNLVGYIGGVAAGVASLYTSPACSAPQNAGTTVTGAILTYGTDDSAAIQAAVNALSDAGGGTLDFDPLKSYWFSRHVPASNVTYDGHGADFYMLPLFSDYPHGRPAIYLAPVFQSRFSTTISGTGQTISSTPSALTVASTTGFPSSGYLYVQGGSGQTVKYTGVTSNTFIGCTVLGASFTATNAGRVANVGIDNVTFKNMIWRGHGYEPGSAQPMFLQGGTNFRLENCDFYRFSNSGIRISDITGARLTNCNFWNVCHTPSPGESTSGNPVGFVPYTFADVFPLTDIVCTGNVVSGWWGEGIDITPASISNPAQTVSFRAVVTNNVVVTDIATSGSPIVMELGGSGGQATYPAADVVISNNVCVAGSGIAVLQPGGSASFPDATYLQRVIVSNNTIVSLAAGACPILFQASYGEVSNNVCSANSGLIVRPGQYWIPITGDFVSGSATVCNVAVQAGWNVTNGDMLSGPGITVGTYLVDGAGTNTWVLSQVFTGATGTSLTSSITPCLRSLVVSENLFHLTAGSGSGTFGVQLTYANDVQLSDNKFVYDDGATTTSTGSINLQKCGWITLSDNVVRGAPGRAYCMARGHDFRVHGGEVHNASSAAAGNVAVQFGEGSSGVNIVDGLHVIDDRASPRVYQCIQYVAGANVILRNGVFIGFTAGATSGATGLLEETGNFSAARYPRPTGTSGHAEAYA